MNMRDFKLEVYFGEHEFSAPYLLTQSDCEAMTIGDLLMMEPGAKEQLLSSWLGYTEVQGAPTLRQTVAGLYETMEADDILMHTGAQEAIYAFMSTHLSKGDHVISIFPVYQSLYEIATAYGCDVSFWKLRNEQNRWVIDFDELQALIRPNTKLIAINTPNNPTGYTFTRQELEKLCAIADRHGLYIFSDEVYKGLDLDGTEKPWVADLYPKAVSLGVLSKAYGLAGLRIGWVATKDKHILDQMTKRKHYLSICNSGPSEVLAEVALRHGSALLARNQGIIEDNLLLAEAFFKRHPQLFVNNPPQCGPIAFHKILIEEPVKAFCDRLVKEAGVLLLPASIYDSDQQYFRMGYGRKNFAESLAAFENYLQKA